jgi:hypothetical protein
MKKWIKIAIPVVAIAVLFGWYAFRPERLVVNRRVDEAMPAGQGEVLVSGRSVAHLREKVAGAGLQLPDDAIKELNAIARKTH